MKHGVADRGVGACGQNEAIRAFVAFSVACRRITANTLSVRGSRSAAALGSSG
jgi:hypothetical protein